MFNKKLKELKEKQADIREDMQKYSEQVFGNARLYDAARNYFIKNY